MTNHDAPSIYPTLRYDDAPAAISFLEKALGFIVQDVSTGDDGLVDHALLAFGNGLVMISSRRPGPSDGPSPFDHGTQCLYLAVDDPDPRYERAVAEGAEIVHGLVDQPYGSREFAVKDPAGNTWSFGTYRPAVAAG